MKMYHGTRHYAVTGRQRNEAYEIVRHTGVSVGSFGQG